MQRHELFLEIGTEELPASYVAPAVAQMAELLQESLRNARIAFGACRTFATPRRLGVVLHEVADGGTDEEQELMGPPVRVAFDADGNPKVPAQKFAEKAGRPVEELERKETSKGEYLMARVLERGVKTTKFLNETLPKLFAEISFPKVMRWGRGEHSFARPVHWVCALLGGQTLSFSFAGVQSGNQSRGHRFLAPTPFEVTTFAKFEADTRERSVIIDPEERKTMILAQSRALAEAAGGRLWEDEELLDLNVNLVESPHPLLASYEDKYLALPKELLRTSMRHHLKCFAVVDASGELLASFVPIGGLASTNEEIVRDGYQRVLRARLADAEFFFNEDRKRTLESRVSELDDVVFQRKLGTYGDKVRRLQKLVPEVARLLEKPEASEDAKRAATLCKADLVSGMVFEFPELQGIMGRYYAKHDGEKEAVAEAIQEFYLPSGQDDPVPTSDVGQILAVAERLDTLVGGFAVGLRPSGSADPYGLRRQAIGLLRILKENKLPGQLGSLVLAAASVLDEKVKDKEAVCDEVLAYLRGRLHPILLKDGWSRDLVDAVCVSALLRDRPIPDLVALLDALQGAVKSGVLAGLAYSFKRVNNILKPAAKKKIVASYAGLGALFFQEEVPSVDASILQEEAERLLWAELERVRGAVIAHFGAGRFVEALQSLLELRAPIDRMFDEVMVMAKDVALRDTRLSLMRAIAHLAFLDFSRINTESEGS